ncbi:hypothetical protein BC831DRAFT_32470 [Entophlyctis helioformis]|nr:hypothetical protein BC831DRAFT_32470 [Entophlyctis helioformis]
MRRLFDSPSLYAEISPQNSRTMLYMRHKALVNRRKRREEHDRIHTENLMLMQRVENKRAHYRARDCDRDRERHLRYLLNMTRFPEAYRRAMVREGLKPGTTPLAPGASRRDSSGRGDSGDGDVQATQQDSIGNASEGAGDHRGSRAGSGSGSGSTISTATKKRLEATSRNMARIGAAYGIKPGELASRGSGSASGSARGSARSSTGSKSSSGHPRDSSSSTKSSTKSSARNHAEPEIKGSSVAAEPVSSAVEPQPAVPEPHGVQILQAHDRTALGFFDDPEQVSLPLSDGSQNDGQATSPPPIDAPLPVILTQSSAYEYTFDDFEDDSEAGSHDIQHGTVVATAAAADGGETVSYRIPVVSIPVDITARADAPRDPDTDSHSHSQSRSSSPHSASKEASDNASGGDEILESASAGRSSAMLDDPFFD